MGLDTQRTHTDRPDRDDAADECRKSIERARKLLPIATGRLSEVYRDNKHPSGLWVAAAKMEKEGMLVTSEIPGGVEKSVLYSIQSKKMPDKMHTFGERVEYPVFMRNEVLDAHKGNVYKDGGYRLWFYNAQGLVSAEIVRGPDGEFISEATHEYLDNGLKKRFFKKGLQTTEEEIYDQSGRQISSVTTNTKTGGVEFGSSRQYRDDGTFIDTTTASGANGEEMREVTSEYLDPSNTRRRTGGKIRFLDRNTGAEIRTEDIPAES